MTYIKCECDCTLFETILTMQFDESEFRIWSHASKLKPEVVCIPIAKCLKCGRYTLPATSMMGKNLADPEVQAYAQLLKIAVEHNDAIEINESLHARVAKIENVSDVPNEPVTEEAQVVKTTKRGRKVSETPI